MHVPTQSRAPDPGARPVQQLLFGCNCGGHMTRKVFLRFERSHATHAGGGNRLAIDVVGHVAGGEDARDVGRGESGAVQRYPFGFWRSLPLKSSTAGA